MPPNRDINLYKALSKSYKAMKRRELELPDSSDTEVLHQYRVSIRRIRSILSLLELEGRIVVDNKLSKALRKLAHLSNTTRDLDMLLAYISRYGDNEDTGDIYDIIRAKRDESFIQFIELLGLTGLPAKIEKRFALLLDELDADGDISTDMILPKILAEWVSMEQEYADILDEGNRDAPHLHDLRKTCKKLRYQGEILSMDNLVPFIEACKKLQSVLGDIHDYNLWAGMLTGVHDGADKLVADLLSRRDTSLREFSEYIATGFDSSVRERIKGLLKA